jgi:putative SOS response-associated peptidase YedK
MCGRFTLDPTAKFYERFQIENRLDELIPRYNITPSQQVPVVISKSPNQVLMMRWGLIPSWAKDPAIAFKTINARIETLTEKPSYRNLIKYKRCIIPASGFYEWEKTPNGKVPHYIHLKKQPLFGFAGLYDLWKNEAGQFIYTFTIITQPPNKVMEKFHDRMPAILIPDLEDNWLDKTITDPFVALEFLLPTAGDAMAEYVVSKEVNKPENDSAELINKI